MEDGRQQYNALGALTATFDYDAAVATAREWFAELDAGVRTKGRYTVEDACADYVKDRHREKGERCAADAEWRFKHTVYDTAFGRAELSKLHTRAIKEWRDGLKLTPSGANRMTTSLRAALNLAVENRHVAATAAQEWRAVKQHKNADKRREIFLDLTQRRALSAAATGSVRDLIEAVMVTGARPGDRVHIGIRDTGIGVPSDRLEAIFEPFVQVDRRLDRPKEGVGLGLAISRDLARGMGGDLAVESEVNVGSTFTLTLSAARTPG